MERNQIMKRLTVVLVLCGLAATATAQEWTTTLDLGYTSKHIWHGFDVFGDAGVYKPSIDFAHESGFGTNLLMLYSDRGGSFNSGASSRVDTTQYQYTFYYGGKAFDACWETNYKIGWRYYDFIKVRSKASDLQELFLEAEFPKLTGNTIVPHVAVYQLWPARSKSDIRSASGTVYLAGFNYLLPSEEMLPNLPLTFSWDIVYNDGFMYADHDLSHMVWGLKTEFDGPGGGKFVPAMYFQNSFERSVNTEDEFWGGISYSVAF